MIKGGALKCDTVINSYHLLANNTEQNPTISSVIISPHAISTRPLNQLIHYTCPNFHLHHEDTDLESFRESDKQSMRLLMHNLYLDG